MKNSAAHKLYKRTHLHPGNEWYAQLGDGCCDLKGNNSQQIQMEWADKQTLKLCLKSTGNFTACNLDLHIILAYKETRQWLNNVMMIWYFENVTTVIFAYVWSACK